MTPERAEDRPGAADTSAQRIDKWLWCARLFKSRTLASSVVALGGVRLTRDGQTTRVKKASANVKPGDRLAFMRGAHLCVLEVRACAERRGPAAEARLLYVDQTPPVKNDAPLGVGAREKGAGRPTKKDRRAVDRLNDLS